MKRPVIVRGIIFVEAVLKHLINKPAVNSFVEVWRFDSEQEKPKRGRKQQDCPKHPVAFERAKKTRRQAILGREKIRSRLFTSAASTRRDAHFSDRRLWFHWEQLYSLHSGTLQAGLRNQRRCAYLCRQSGESCGRGRGAWRSLRILRSEEHTSELQSRFDLVCRLLLEKKK